MLNISVLKGKHGEICVWLFDAHLCHELSVLSVDASDGPDVLTGLQRLVELRVS